MSNSLGDNVRIVHVFPHSARLSGGHTNAIHAFMQGQAQQGIDVRGLSPLPTDLPPELEIPIDSQVVSEFDFASPGLARAALELVEGRRRPLFHFHGCPPPFLRLGRTLAKAGIPYVVTSQGQLHYRTFVHWAKKAAYVNLGTPFFRAASGLHFVTQRERLRCKRLLPFWKKPVLVQQNVVKVPDPAGVSPASRDDYQLPKNAFVFAYLGRLHIEHKGLDLLLKGFARLDPGAGVFLALIGPDWAGDRQVLERLARQLKCQDRVRFLGPHVGPAKWRLLKIADAFISPSRWDACPSAVTEAIGFGLPTIVSATMNPAPELVEGGAALAPQPSPEALAGAMQKLVNDSALRESLGARGREWVRQNCSLEVAGLRFEQFYHQLLG